MASGAPTPEQLARLAQLAVLFDAIKANRVVNYAYVASCTILTFDYFITLPQEIDLMWPASLSIPKVLFLVLRVWQFFHLALGFGYYTNTSTVGASCNAGLDRHAYSSIAGSTVCEAVNYLRIYGFAGRNRALGFFLVPAFVGTATSQMYFVWKFQKTVKFAEIPWEGVGCIPSEGDNRWLSVVFILVFANLAIVTGCMVILAFRKRRQFQGVGSLVELFYRDGIFYFIALGTLATANIIFEYTAPTNGLQFTMVQMQVFLHQILTSRMLIHLRAWAQKGSRIRDHSIGPATDTKSMLGELEFADGVSTSRSLLRSRYR